MVSLPLNGKVWLQRYLNSKVIILLPILILIPIPILILILILKGNCDENGNSIDDIEINSNSNSNTNTKKISKVMKNMIMMMTLKGVLSLVLGLLLNIIWILALIYFSKRIRYH